MAQRAGRILLGGLGATLLLAACVWWSSPPRAPGPTGPAGPAILTTVTALPATPTESPATTTPAPTPTPPPTPAPTPTAPPTPTATPTTPPAAPPTQTPTRAPVAASMIIRGRPETGLIALTFDAGGRSAGETSSVLDTLHRARVRSTFFLTGEWVRANPGLVRRMVAEGHELANHSYNHPDLTKVSDEAALSQLRRTEQAVHEVAGVALTRYVRPPFGAFNQHLISLLTGAGYEVVYWSLDSRDWRQETTGAEVAEWVISKAGAGDIVVFHCYTAKAAYALPRVLEAMRSRNVRASTLSELLGR